MHRRALAALLILLPASPAAAADEFSVQDGLNAACREQLARDDNWVGWRRDFGGGYTDSFRFVDGRWDGGVSVVEVTRLIDALVSEVTTWCYGADGMLALATVTMASPDMTGGEFGPLLVRQGRIYADNGAVVGVQGWVEDASGTVLGPVDSPDLMLARDCNLLDLRLTVDAAEAEYLSVLGDIEGNRPDYGPDQFDWCAVATLP